MGYHAHMPFPDAFPPELIAKAAALHIDPLQIDEHFIHGGGKGGQKINKTASCVQLIYTPMNLEIRCQEHREQHKNRLRAYEMLITKVEEWRNDVERALAEHDYKEHKQVEPRPAKAKRAMLRDKKHRGAVKKNRQSPITDAQ